MVLALVLLVFMPVFVYCHSTGQQVLGGAGAASVILVATLEGSVAGWLVGYRAPRLALSYGGVGGLVAAGGTVLLMQAESLLFRRLGIYGAMVVGATIGTGFYQATLKPVGSGLRVLAKQLQARGYMLLNIGSDSDAYSCIVVRQEAAEEIIATNPPPGVQIRPL